MHRTLTGILGSFGLVLASLFFVPVASEAALAEPGYLMTATKKVSRNGESYASLSVSCKAGDTPVWGGYTDSLGDDIRRVDEVFSYGSGGTYTTNIVDFSPASGVGETTVTTQAMCIPLANFSNSKLVFASGVVDSTSHLAVAAANCGAGWYAAGASVTFNSFDSTVLTSSPFAGTVNSWIAQGWIGTAGKTMTLSLRCVQGASLDVLRVFSNSDSVGWGTTASATCPTGFAFFNGGTYQSTGDGQAITIDPQVAFNFRTLQSRSLSLTAGTMVTTVVCAPVADPIVTVSGSATPSLTSPNARWTFTATDPAAIGGYGLTTKCLLQYVDDNWAVVYDKACSSPVDELSLAEGTWMLTVTATTGDGRWRSTAAPVTIDHSFPVVTFVEPPNVAHDSPAVTVHANVTDAHSFITSLTCALDDAAFAACGQASHGTAPHEPGCESACDFYTGSQEFELTGLAEGGHVLHVKATDSRTNTATYDLPFRVDTTLPTVTQTGPAARFTVGSSTMVTWAGQDPGGSGIASYAVRWQRAAYTGSFGAWTSPVVVSGTTLARQFSKLARGYTYCYAVSGTDRAGNTTPWTAARCTAIPLDDRDLAASQGWARVSPKGYFRGTALMTRKQGSTLSVTGASVKRVAVVAQKCPTCGVVGVIVGGKPIGKINLKAAKTSRAVIALPAFSLRKGVVTIKVLSSGKPVQIDALGLSRT